MKFKHVLACLLTGAIFTVSTISLRAATYTIQPGDTLSSISSKTGTSVQEIMDANGITDPNKIKAGKSLILSDAHESSTPNKAASLYELFDEKYYAEKYPDVVAVYGTSKEALYNHFTLCGMQEGRNISADFDVNAYRSAYQDLQKIFGDDISKYYEHYILFGQNENRTLTTTEACAASGITVYNVDGKVLSTPVAAKSTSSHKNHSSSSSSSSSSVNEYWKTGTWYCVETEVNADGVMQSQGHFPYELFQLTDNEDGTFTYYEAVGHGAWIDGEFDYTPFDFSGNDEKRSNLRLAIRNKHSKLEYCDVNYTDSDSDYLGIYDEGCIHERTVTITSTPEHNWELDETETAIFNLDVYRCSECRMLHYSFPKEEHLDKNEDGSCDICHLYFREHEYVDSNDDKKCETCGRYCETHAFVDDNGDLRCDLCNIINSKH